MILKGDIFLVNFGKGEGSEQQGVRPAVIVQNNTGNKNSTTVIVAAITSKGKKSLPTHVDIKKGGKTNLSFDSTVLLEQIRTIDKKRIQGGKIGKVENLKTIDNAIMVSLGIKL
jgi:mRNA interferase MazF